MSVHADWQGILEEDETVLWQGRPGPGLNFRPSHALTMLFGLAFAGFALFWMIAASQAGGFFWSFGLIHFAAGIGVALGPILWPAWKRRHSFYTLTNKRAFIAEDLPFYGRRLKGYEIGPDTVLELRDDPLGSVYFAHEWRRSRNGDRRKDIGFEKLDNAREVYDKLRAVQRGDA